MNKLTLVWAEVQGRIMERSWQLLLLLWLTAVVAMNVQAKSAESVEDELVVKNLTNKLLQVIPHNGNNSTITKLVIEGNLITLNETDQLALASYSTLAVLHLGGNLVTAIPAKYFSVVPNLRVLSLARNNISSLDPEAFSGLNVLTELDLSYNLLTSLPPQLTRGLNNLQMLNLQENPWICSCPLLTAIGEINALNVTIGWQQVICASPAKQAGHGLLEATALCSPSPPAITADPQKPTASVHSQQSWGPSAVLMTTLSCQNNCLSKDQTPVLGNTWKFTASVAALALTTFMLIVFAIKGPSWYKLFHNYRHRILHQEDDEGEDIVSTVFSQTEGCMTHQTFTFEEQNVRTEEEEEEEDGYFEDPYIRTED